MTALDARVDCAIVIVTYNSARDIGRLLDSLPAATAGLSVRTVVVDNGSTDETVALIQAYQDIVCIEAEANLGYSGGINLARRHAGDYSSLLILNPDLVLDPGAVGHMFQALSEPGVGIVVPMLLDEDGRQSCSLRRRPTLSRALGECLLGDHLAWRPGFLSEMVRDQAAYAYQHPVDWATGAAFLVSEACDHAVGAWDEQFFLYSEEVDYAARARAAGYRIDYLPTARAQHRGAGSGQSSELTALMAVNRIRYMEKTGRRSRVYQAVVALHELLRSASPAHRTAFRAVIDRSSWKHLPAGPLTE